MTPRRILFLSQRVPFPPNRGDKIPTYHYVRHLARHHSVTVACLADGVDDLQYAEQLRDFVSDVEVELLSPRTAKCRALAALASGRAMTCEYFNERRLRSRVHQRIAAREFDLAIVFSSGMAPYVDGFSNLPKIIQFADLDSQKWRQYAEDSVWPKSWIYQTESRRLLRYERRIASTFDRSLVCAARELDDAKGLMPDVTIECLPNGVDSDYFQPQTNVTYTPNSLIFTGVMNYRPNVDAMMWFCGDILPRIRHECPDIRLTICGSSPNRQIGKLASIPGVTVTGGVPDVRPFLAQATVAVIPLRLARGIQNKILEAMAMGVPVVTTPSAAAGVEAESGQHFHVAGTAHEFAQNVVRLLKHSHEREVMSRAARVNIERHHGWKSRLRRLDEIIEVSLERRGARTDRAVRSLAGAC